MTRSRGWNTIWNTGNCRGRGPHSAALPAPLRSPPGMGRGSPMAGIFEIIPVGGTFGGRRCVSLLTPQSVPSGTLRPSRHSLGPFSGDISKIPAIGDPRPMPGGLLRSRVGVAGSSASSQQIARYGGWPGSCFWPFRFLRSWPLALDPRGTVRQLHRYGDTVAEPVSSPSQVRLEMDPDPV